MKCDLKVKLKRIITFTKGPGKKIRNQNNEGKIEKHNIIILNWRMKLKTTKTFTKKGKKKKRNSKNKDNIEKYNI